MHSPVKLGTNTIRFVVAIDGYEKSDTSEARKLFEQSVCAADRIRRPFARGLHVSFTD
jgi:hypothetical protein